MIKIILMCLFVIILFRGSSQTHDVLFIGNSYTYSNNLPEMLHDLALSNGDTVNYDSNTPGGYTFESHTTNPTTLAKIKEKKWDFVVLQEQSQRPSFPPSQVAVEVYPYAAILDSIIKSSDICTETVFFMTWGRKYGDQVNCPVWPPVCTYLGMQQRLRESYMEMGNTLSATVAPVGIAWKNSIEADSMINLFSGDNSHPSLMGSYLAACVFYATIYQKSPVGLPYISTLSQPIASFLQNIAAITVLDSLSTWNISANSPKADFSYIVNASTVNFTNSSLNVDKYSWDFGDGNTDTVADPVHTYTTPGTYMVSMEASSVCGFDKTTDTVEIVSTGVNQISDTEGFLIYPNPAQDRINIQFSTLIDAKLEIQDLNGRTVLREQLNNTGSKNNFNININSIVPGTYIIKISGKGFGLSEKLIVY